MEKKGYEIADIGMTIRSIFVYEFEDALFHHDSAILLPSQPKGPSSKNGASSSSHTHVTGLSLVADIFKYAELNPEKKLIIVGNTDTSGKPKYNFELSMIRASSVLYLLEGEKKKWVDNSHKKNKVEDFQQILKHYATKWGWDCDPGEVNDDLNLETKAAVRQFQETYNDKFGENIGVDGIIGEETEGAIFDCYIKEIADMLKTTPSELSNYKKNIKYVDNNYQILACGESRPIEAKHKKNYRSQTNRRIEALFIDQGEKPEISCPAPMGPYQNKTCDVANCPFIPKKGFKLNFLEPTEYPVEKLPPKIFLEVEIFDLNKNEEDVMAFLGKGNSFEEFEIEKSIDRDKWESIEGHTPGEKAFKVELKKEDFLEKTIKTQAKRKYVATSYDDGERAWEKEEKVENKKGEWPEKVFIDQDSEPWPTEELLSQIFYYSESEETKFSEEKKKNTIPQLNKIVIIQKDNGIEYVIDRFVSL